MVPIRHRFYDDFIMDCVDKIRGGNHHQRGAVGEALPIQFVNLACGLDSRAFRLPWPR
jgi:O-methyltransferase involved in polyketide biosynthesis